MSVFLVVALALMLATYASFVWAVRSFFVREGPLEPGMRLIAAGGSLTMAAHLAAMLAADARPVLLLGGSALYAASLGLFWWAVRVNRVQPLAIAFSELTPEHLVTRGPYALVRHPFYSAYLLAWIAGLVATAQPLLLSTVVAMGALYHRAARLEEAMFADSHLAAAYAAYKERVGMLFPRLFTTRSVVGGPETARLPRR